MDNHQAFVWSFSVKIKDIMAFANPALIARAFLLRPGMTVADFGAGSGAYALEMSRLVLPGGRVYAVDVQKELLVTLKNAAAEKRYHNIEILWGDVEQAGGSKLADQSVDFVLVSNLLFQTTAGYSLAVEAKRILKNGGLVGVIDWREVAGSLGPRREQVVPSAQAQQIFTDAGFLFDHDFPAGDHHYGLLFKKSQ